MTTVFLDLETGGTESHHPDTQIAAIAVSPAWEELDHFEAKIQFDEAACDPVALDVNSYDADTWTRCAIPEAAALGTFCAFLKKHATVQMTSKRTGRPYQVARIAGHNIATFDVPRLRRMAARNGDVFLPAAWWYPLDTLQLALWHFSARDDAPKNFQLSTLAAHFGVATDGAHDALADVRLSMAVAHEIRKA